MPLTMALIQKTPSIYSDHKRRDIIVSIKKIKKTIHPTLYALCLLALQSQQIIQLI